MKNNVNLNGALVAVTLMFVSGLLWVEAQPEKVVPTNDELAMAYVSDKHPDLNCGSVKIYDELDGVISFISYDNEGNPMLCASINKEYYMDKYEDMLLD